MELGLLEALRTTGAVREFTDEPVPEETVVQILDAARFAPSGGNRQGWRVVVIQDAAVRRALRDVYASAFREYAAQTIAGLVPWAPITDLDAERRALAQDRSVDLGTLGPAAALATHLHRAPVLLAVLGDLRALAAADRDLPRYGVVGGASLYPFCWSVLLAARAHGVGGVLTTMTTRRESDIKRLLHVPEDHCVAAVLALGYPRRPLRRLLRRPVAGFATRDRWDGPAFGACSTTTERG